MPTINFDALSNEIWARGFDDYYVADEHHQSGRDLYTVSCDIIEHIGHQFWSAKSKEWMVKYGFYNEETGWGAFSPNDMDEIDQQLYQAKINFSSSRRPRLWHHLFVRGWEREILWQQAEQYCRQFEQYYERVHHTGFTKKQIARYEYYCSIVECIWDIIDARYRAGIHREFDYEDGYEQWQWGCYFNTDASKLERIAMFAVETDLTTMGCCVEKPFPKYMTNNYWHFKEIGNWLREIEK